MAQMSNSHLDILPGLWDMSLGNVTALTRPWCPTPSCSVVFTAERPSERCMSCVVSRPEARYDCCSDRPAWSNGNPGPGLVCCCCQISATHRRHPAVRPPHPSAVPPAQRSMVSPESGQKGSPSVWYHGHIADFQNSRFRMNSVILGKVHTAHSGLGIEHTWQFRSWFRASFVWSKRHAWISLTWRSQKCHVYARIIHNYQELTCITSNWNNSLEETEIYTYICLFCVNFQTIKHCTSTYTKYVLIGTYYVNWIPCYWLINPICEGMYFYFSF